jgi:hypothetical protein
MDDESQRPEPYYYQPPAAAPLRQAQGGQPGAPASSVIPNLDPFIYN